MATLELRIKTIYKILILKQEKYHLVRKILRKNNISYFLIRTCTCAYQGVRNVSFSENVVNILNDLLDQKQL